MNVFDGFTPMMSTDKLVTLPEVQKVFNEIVNLYKSLYNFDLSYMKVKLSKIPVFNNGKPCYDILPEEFGGSWTKLRIIYINYNPRSVIRHYWPDKQNNEVITEEEVHYFLKLIVSHELAHEVFNNVADNTFKENIINKAIKENFTTEYLDAIRGKIPEYKFRVEIFCEYMAKSIINNKPMKGVITSVFDGWDAKKNNKQRY